MKFWKQSEIVKEGFLHCGYGIIDISQFFFPSRILTLEKERHARLVRKHDVQSSFYELDEIYFKNEMERKGESK